MPRIVNEVWTGVGFGVEHGEAPMADDRGNVVHDGRGVPKTQPIATLVFVLDRPDGQTVVRVPLEERARAELVRKLTGGVHVARPGDVPAAVNGGGF